MTLRSITMLTAALMVAGSTTAGTARAAEATSTATTQPTTTSRASAPVTARVDIDGDKRRDTVRLTQLASTRSWHRFVLSVRTAAGRTDTMRIAVPNQTSVKPSDLWWGTAHADGVRGAEILLDLSGNLGDAPYPHMYTWRRGRIASAPAPEKAAPGQQSNYWAIIAQPFQYSGYTFSSRNGARTVTWNRTTPGATPEPRRYSGTSTTYRWTSAGWRKVSTKPLRGLSEDSAFRLADWHGITWR
ncbi:hypothetical protein [Gephyromycinifex aptenodytis]|uniref:hypothetical protein n=1 Tax=Gephyromycinifex aptenodytis TaxID=2716227 RepID=UPI001446CAA8|nr:hypothetical protein [Gephyromycinifex aptenodytis]